MTESKCSTCGKESRFVEDGRCVTCVSNRDRFAAAALTGMLANPEWSRALKPSALESGIAPEDLFAMATFEFADAMLKARRMQAEKA